MSMLRRHRIGWIVGLAVATVLVAGTGLGFSAFTATATVTGNASAASVDLVITSVDLTAGSHFPYGPYVQTSPLPSSDATAWVNNTVPGEEYDLTIIVENIGSSPAYQFGYVTTTTTGGPSDCHVAATFTNLVANSPPGDTLGPSVPFSTFWALYSGTFPLSCGGDTYLQFTIQFTGSLTP